jgi:hypothetical protein
MSEGSELNLDFKGLNDKDFLKILTKLSYPHRRRHRKCKRQRYEEGVVAKILANLPAIVSGLSVWYNGGIGDAAGMKHLHLIPDSVTYLDLRYCNLSPIRIKRVCGFLKMNKSITTMRLNENRIGDKGFKDVTDLLEVNNTIITLHIPHYEITAASCSHLSEGLAQNTGLRCWLSIGTYVLTDEHIENLCPGLAVNRGLETLDLSYSRHLTEMGVGYLENVL